MQTQGTVVLQSMQVCGEGKTIRQLQMRNVVLKLSASTLPQRYCGWHSAKFSSLKRWGRHTAGLAERYRPLSAYLKFLVNQTALCDGTAMFHGLL
jgi:hypothetical protein